MTRKINNSGKQQIIPMLAKIWDDHYHKLEYPVAIQPKLDGVRMIWDGKDYYSRTGKNLFISSQIEDDLKHYFEGFSLDGELYYHNSDFDKINGQARRLVGRIITTKMNYHVFDTPVDNLHFKERWLKVLEKPQTNSIKFVETFIVNDEEGVNTFYDKFLFDGYEGLIVRQLDRTYESKRTDALLKLKKFIEDDGIIVEMLPGKGKYKYILGALSVKGKTNKGVKWSANVGTGFSDHERRYLWNYKSQFIGKTIVVKYQNITKAGKARMPVFIRIKNKNE